MNPLLHLSAFSLQPSAFPPALPDVLKVPPISQRGNVNEIVGKFGGSDQLRNAVNQLQSLLYAA
ncbi:MAG: hypothetical protein IH623_30655 [Verrucomicrobia bacterium]|nr:hypothetical protein [Verrucomicrobiota bacterium]